MALLTAAAEALVAGAQSYALAAARAILLGWHPFPVLAWVVVGPLCALGWLWAWERLRQPRAMPDESHGVKWRCDWKGPRIEKMDPVCPNPNCGHDLRITQAGGQYGSDLVFVCNGPGCGFRLRHQEIPAVVLADVRRDLEGQAAGKPPMPPKARKTRVWVSSI